METIESKVAETILQEPKTIKIGEKTFSVPSPTPATLIQVSKLISFLPSVKLNGANFIYETLAIADKSEVIGTIAATLILGVNKQTNALLKKESRLKWLRIKKRKNIYEVLGEEILLSVSNEELESLIIDGLKRLEIQPFFQIITSLLEVNLLKATR